MERESRASREERIKLYEQKVIGFMFRTAAEGADKIVPDGNTPEQWKRDLDITKAISYMNLSGNDLKDTYGVTRSRIQQIVQACKKKLHNNATEEIKQEFSLGEILTRKPSPLLRGATNSLQVKQQVEQGVTTRSEIAENTGLRPKQVGQALERLKMHGIVAAKDNVSVKELDKQFEEEDDDTKLQEMLDDLNHGSILHFISSNRGKQIALSFLTNVLTSEGFHVRPRELKFIADAIKEAEIPIRVIETKYTNKRFNKEYKQIYTIVLTKHKDRILEVIRQSRHLFERLSDNPVKLVYGPEPEKYPNTTLLAKKDLYRYVGVMLQERFGLRRRRIKYDDLFNDSPVPIFRMKQGCYYQIEQEEDLVVFVKEKMRT